MHSTGEGNYRETQNVAERALSVGRATLSPETPTFALLLTVLAHSLEDKGKRGRPLKLYRQAAGIMKNAGKDSKIGAVACECEPRRIKIQLPAMFRDVGGCRIGLLNGYGELRSGRRRVAHKHECGVGSVGEVA